MNSIIFKGVSSAEIRGLLISELPPITKPQMRTKETLIDGKDGSLIEELGYSPYDKPVSIGLYGNFDIDEIIKFFSGEGEVIFSNEPEKAYRAKIFAKIDYTRLLRFRKAKILFRTQPYKYKAFEEPTVLYAPNSGIINEGLEVSKPLITLTGSGTVELLVNGSAVFSYTFPVGENQVEIDSEKEDAYWQNELKNRNMNGEFPLLQPGINKIEWTGDIQSLEILPRSRWL
ncbi:MAG: hypothetical protein E7593_03970 [Ruminococcaceae bacterium]|nr:hypothetical protein [Oscillospiraceae bacterium]